MKWEDFDRDDTKPAKEWPFTKTNIQCPRCGEEVYLDSSKVLTTYPVKYAYQCKSCGWVGYSHNSWGGGLYDITP